jgi:hypothetical protein
MLEMAEVSVVMATYNGGRFLSEQLQSIARQSQRPLELIVSDDGSTDDTVAIAERFRANAPFAVRIVRNPERLGYGANFLSAAKLAKGEFIAFSDQDDVWQPSKIEIAAATLRSSNADLHVHAADVIDDAGKIVGDFAQTIRRRETFEPMTLAPWGVFYGLSMTMRADILSALDPDRRGRHTFDFQGSLSHDLWVYFVASSLGRVTVDDLRLASYRRHGSNETPRLDGRLIDRLSAWLGVKAHPQLRRDEIAADRARLLADFAAASPDHRLARHAATASDWWRRVSDHEVMRTGIYGGSAARSRLVTLARLALTGGYGPPSRGGLGRRLMAKDAIAGALGIQRGKRA